MAEGENEVRWDGLCSRDPTTRETALENIRQLVLKKTECLRSPRETPQRSDGLSNNAGALDELNKLLAHLLMLSKRCPFKDVREKSELILKSVQVRKSVISFTESLVQQNILCSMYFFFFFLFASRSCLEYELLL